MHAPMAKGLTSFESEILLLPVPVNATDYYYYYFHHHHHHHFGENLLYNANSTLSQLI
jgi:hypothetical protein